MITLDALEVLTDRVSRLVRQFGLDVASHGSSGDRAVADRVTALVNAVAGLQTLIDQRRKERASGPGASNW